ncbi:dUTP diphosphatase [Metabacillus sp. RGM 3146]|uniref:dUTP diphosphatase n=1 Tax=Metabacillus sp. RGM 3146 TaxID=3401092 RepID=UPI003B9D48C0
MDFAKLFVMQKELDKKIQEQHALLSENLIEKKILALYVEIGELANETRCFKFWSTKPASDRETILEEFVDGVHFLLSIGLELGWEGELELKGENASESATVQFLAVFESVSDFRKKQSKDTYLAVFREYLYLGELLGFSSEEVERAYVKKNEINHERQEQGY